MHHFGLATIPGRQRWRCALGVALPLLVLGAVADSAQAGCGDYVIFKPPGSIIHSPGTMALPLTGQFLPGTPDCHGLMCRGTRPLDSVPSPLTPQQIEQRPVALLAGSCDAEGPFLAGAGWPRLDETPLDGFRQALLRPPCA